MPRRPRIHLDGQPLHIVQRGHNREACFFAEEDYHAYLRGLKHALAEANCFLHAYALMPNHVHLLLTPKRAETVPRLIMELKGSGWVYFPGMLFYARRRLSARTASAPACASQFAFRNV